MVISWDLIETEQINMNNLYKRPMFRKGGSAQGGITSGLQAPRQGYATNENNLVQQGDTSKLGKVQSELALLNQLAPCLLYTSPSPRDGLLSRMPSSA